MWKTCKYAFHQPPLDIIALGKLSSIFGCRTFLSTPMPEVKSMDPNIKSYQDLYKFSIEKSDKFWGILANRIDWQIKFETTVTGDFSTDVRWFPGGKLNASVNCVDRHAATNPDGIALIHEKDEPNQHEFITYKELKNMVVNFAFLLRTVGVVKKGDRVALYMPTSPVAIAMMLACSRIGAIHSVAFAGFSAEALASRINDAKATVVITTDIIVRGGKVTHTKKTVDKALEHCPSVKTVIVDAHDGDKPKCRMVNSRDHSLQDLLVDCKKSQVVDHIEYVDSNHPLFILYTSGSTGAPKGLMHSTGGYLLYTMITHQYAFDCLQGDKFGCVADIGWITGHSYVVYAPLANGTTTLLFESTPTYPNPGRYWEMVQRLRLSHFYAAPTAIRLLIKYGSEWVKKYDRSSLRILGTVGEPINVEAWEWYKSVVGDDKCTVVDTWWQTETGGVALSPRPSGPNDHIEPAIAMRPFFGMMPKLMTEGENRNEGPLCLSNPWPGLAISIWGSPERFKETYFSTFPNYYFTGDGATCDHNGYWKITGRIDDVINVTGHRLGTTEVEHALHEHELVSEVAVVGYPHEIKGEGIFAYVVAKHLEDPIDYDLFSKELKSLCKSKIAGYAVPDFIMFTEGLPKTRSGKIMRRILRKVATGGNLEEMGDISTLAEPQIVSSIIDLRKKFN